jgi:hypothetical protein
MARFVQVGEHVLNLDRVSIILNEAPGRTKIYVSGYDGAFYFTKPPLEIINSTPILEYHDTPQTLRRIK